MGIFLDCEQWITLLAQLPGALDAALTFATNS